MSVERFVCDIIEKRKQNKVLLALLYLFSFCVKSVLWIYHAFWDRKTPLRLPCFVVSVGNVVAGGTGKTPFVQLLVSMFSQKIGILSRGYCAKRKKDVQEVYDTSLASEVGDEPLLLKRTTDACVIVGKDRRDSARYALEKQVKVLVLDDGFQVRYLHHDFSIVLIDSTDPWGKGFFLPRGYLRDFPKRLHRANLIVITRLEMYSEILEQEHRCKELEQEIRRYTAAPIVGFAARYRLAKECRAEKIGAFCGIAKPLSFQKALSSCHVVAWNIAQDHRLPKDLKTFAVHAKKLGATCLVCTEKDRVKLRETLALPVFSLHMELVCVWRENLWKEIVCSLHNRENSK